MPTVVITGASSGIGKAAALKFAQENWNVALVARKEDDLKATLQQCTFHTSQVKAFAADAADEQAVKHVANTVTEEFGGIDVWVNNAAVTAFGRLEDCPSEVCRRVIETNLMGYIHGARAAIPVFRNQGSGILIQVSSQVGKVAMPYVSLYCATKFAINGLSQSLRMELKDAPDIHVCTVLAASIDTPLFQHAANYTGRAVKPTKPVYSPQMVADKIFALTKKPQAEVYAGGSAKS